MPVLDPRDVPALEGWQTVAEVADLMKLSKNGLRKRIFDFGEFPGVRKVEVGTGDNVIFLLPDHEVKLAVAAELAEREKFQNERVPAIRDRKARQVQRRKIMDWATTQGYETATMGRLPTALIAAYRKDHPDETII